MKNQSNNKNSNIKMSISVSEETKDKFIKLFNQYKCIYSNKTQNDFLNDLLEKYNDKEFKENLRH